jgi:hypothetical protein
VHHRDLRSRPPATSPSSNACGGNPDRYLMSVATSHTTALSALVVDRHRCCSAQCISSIAFEVARSAETQPQHRPFKPGHPIQHPITRSWRLDSFRHPPHRDQIAIGRGGIFLASPPAGSFPGRFRATAPVPVALSRSDVVRNPSHNR